MRSYRDFVLSSGSGRLYCAITPTVEFESWNLVDPVKPIMSLLPSSPVKFHYDRAHDLFCSSHPSLIHHDGDLYLVIKFMTDWYNQESESVTTSKEAWIAESSSYDMSLAYKTKDFILSTSWRRGRCVEANERPY